MPYTTEDGGRLNNFAQEPKMYTAQTNQGGNKTQILIVGVLGILLVGGLIAVAFAVS